MNTIGRILNLIRDKGITEKQFIKEIGLNSSAVSDWKSGQSQSYKKHADKISAYFNVSTDYLLCKTDDPTPPGKKAHDTVDVPTFVTLQSFYKELPVKDQEKMDRVLKTIFEEMFPKDKDKDNGVQK